jgi:GH15 family glucan-1,4-alpha-glucosidase
MAASHFAEEFGETGLAKDYAEGAKKMRQGMDKHLYLPDEQRFARMIQRKQDETIDIDAAIDASLYGIFAFGAYKPDEMPVQNTMRQIFETLEVNGGICRYLNDSYYRDNDQSLSNPWFITTLWKPQNLAASAKTSEDLKAPLAVLEWIADKALPSGVLAEQLHPETLQPISVSPLTWSHGSYIIAVQEYLNKRLEIEKCPGCGKSKDSKIRTVK